VIALAAGVLVGLINGVVVVVLHVDSFIATLAMGSLLAGASFWLTQGQQLVLPPNSGLLTLGAYEIWSIPLPFFVMLLLGAIMYVVIEHMPVGRRLFAVGGNPQASRLVGVRVNRVVFGSLLVSAGVAALTGITLVAELGISSSDLGPPYLLPAFSAVFLGATQIKPGRVNIIGTFVGIYLLATGIKGLQLAGAQSYVNDLFNGAALIIAVALSARAERRN
jgi:ribose transport system permease protein